MQHNSENEIAVEYFHETLMIVVTLKANKIIISWLVI